MELRDYQLKAINDTREGLKKFNSPCLVAPCGAGKSVISATMAKMATDKGNTVLFMVHRLELVNQIKSTFERAGVDMKLCDVFMISQAQKSDREYNLILTDEAHHSVASSYKKVYEKYPNTKRVNVTATPCRLDGNSIGETCDVIIPTVSTKWLIENKYLAPYIYYAPNINIVLPNIRGSDFNASEVEFKSTIYGRVSDYIKEGVKTIVYCPNIEFSKKLAEHIGGIHIDGNTPPRDRALAMEKFRLGKVEILLNVDLFGEGIDVPDCECVMLLRPTMSTSLYIQQSMRCMRYKPGKVAKIYDFVGNCYRHGLPDDDREWKLDKKTKTKNPSGEPGVLVRQCNGCFKVYSGNDKICPYCMYDNGLTPRQIKEIEQVELEQIKESLKFEKKKATWNCKTLEDFKAVANKYGYDERWAYIKYDLKQKKAREI